MREYVLTILVAAAVTYLLTPVIQRIALATGALTPVRDRDVHAIPTPRLGGIAMFLGLAAGLLVASQLPRLRVVFEDTTWLFLLAGCGLICLLGALDDRWSLDALTKLAGQVAVGGLLALGGVQLLWLPLPSGALGLTREQGVVLTVLLIVATVNAVNFIDGLDGLAAGIVGIAAVSFFTYAYVLSVVKGYERMAMPAMITAILAGMCAGFLPHNFNPARVFMGDSGSMLIGVLLAASTITLTGWFDSGTVTALNLFPAILPLLIPVAVLAVPFVDLALAVVRRTRAGRLPWAPDKEHLHHRLLRIGHSHARAVLIMYFWAALIGFATVAVSIVDVPILVMTVAATVGLLALLTLHVPRLIATRRR
ncbi:MAG: MraY family glycosyltransferase [Streptosporangiaceae bacterium]